MSQKSEEYLTPTELAAQWRCDPERVLALIHKGALSAFTLSPPGAKRPRYRIKRSAIEAYENGKPSAPPPPPPVVQRRRSDAGVKKFF